MDIAIQEYGDVSGVALLIDDNKVVCNLHSTLAVGTVLYVRTISNPNLITEFYQQNAITPATAYAIELNNWLLAFGTWVDTDTWNDTETVIL